MTTQPNGQRQKRSSSRTSWRDAILWVLLAAICFVLANVGFKAGGPWYVFFGSIVLSAATGYLVVLAVRALRRRERAM